MTREKELYEAANKFSDEYKYSEDVDYISIRVAFREGAEWADNHPVNVWHSASEEPKCKELLIVYCDDIGGLPIDTFIYHGAGDYPWEEVVKIYSIIYWAYAKDLLPKGGEK